MHSIVSVPNGNCYSVAVLGATGLVGRAMIRTLEKRNFPVSELRLLASQKSAGTKIDFCGNAIVVQDARDADFTGVEIALFSAGSTVAKTYVDRAVSAGAVVIDNSSAFRMDADVPLIVPEVNPEEIHNNRGIIANPNCSTIQLVVALKPLLSLGIDHVFVSTYQAVSGMGWKGVEAIAAGEAVEDFFPVPGNHRHLPLKYNVLPQCDEFIENGYTKEEMKVLNESRKILGIPDLKVSPTAVRVPVLYGHSESVAVRFTNPVSIEEIRRRLADAPGIIIADEPDDGVYPHPRMAEGSGNVYVGRIRKDVSDPNTVMMFVVADNVLKGAAWNAVQIAELLMRDIIPTPLKPAIQGSG